MATPLPHIHTHTHARTRARSPRQISLCLPPPELESKLGWIPGSIAKAMSFRQDFDLQTRVLQLLDEIVIPRGEPCVIFLVALYSSSYLVCFSYSVPRPPSPRPPDAHAAGATLHAPGDMRPMPPPPAFPFPTNTSPLFAFVQTLMCCVQALRDEARAMGLAHIRHGMDLAARQGLTWILQVGVREGGGAVRRRSQEWCRRQFL